MLKNINFTYNRNYNFRNVRLVQESNLTFKELIKLNQIRGKIIILHKIAVWTIRNNV